MRNTLRTLVTGALTVAGALTFSLGGLALASPATAGSTRVEVGGIVVPATTTPTTGNNAGPNFIASRNLTTTLCGQLQSDFSCLPPDNGFDGTVLATEDVRRIWRGGNAFYTVTSKEVFKGSLYVGGQVVCPDSSFSQTLVASGPLKVVGTIDDPRTAASALNGTWTITGSGTGCFASLHGHGTITWPGLPAAPTYQGTITY